MCGVKRGSGGRGRIAGGETRSQTNGTLREIGLMTRGKARPPLGRGGCEGT